MLSCQFRLSSACRPHRVAVICCLRYVAVIPSGAVTPASVSPRPVSESDAQMLHCLRRNLGTYKSCVLLIVAPVLWCLSVGRAVDTAACDMLSGMAVGAGLAVLLAPVMRLERYRLLYHRLIFFLGLLIAGGAMALQFASPAMRGPVVEIFLAGSSFYVHSALWIYGRYDLSQPLEW